MRPSIPTLSLPQGLASRLLKTGLAIAVPGVVTQTQSVDLLQAYRNAQHYDAQ